MYDSLDIVGLKEGFVGEVDGICVAHDAGGGVNGDGWGGGW